MPAPAPPLAKFACLSCRTVMKRPPLLPTDPAARRNAARPIEVRECPSCHGEAFWMGSNFRAPPRSDDRGWQVVAMLVRAGLPYCRIDEPVAPSSLDAMGVPSAGVRSSSIAVGPWPTTLAEARAFIDRFGRFGLPFWRPGDPVGP